MGLDVVDVNVDVAAPFSRALTTHAEVSATATAAAAATEAAVASCSLDLGAIRAAGGSSDRRSMAGHVPCGHMPAKFDWGADHNITTDGGPSDVMREARLRCHWHGVGNCAGRRGEGIQAHKFYSFAVLVLLLLRQLHPRK